LINRQRIKIKVGPALKEQNSHLFSFISLRGPQTGQLFNFESEISLKLPESPFQNRSLPSSSFPFPVRNLIASFA
jgi:hypothetical protein